MTTYSGSDDTTSTDASRATGTGVVPRAQRPGRQGWRDPRLWVGVAIVAASVVLGARVLASADDSVAVWAVADTAVPGDRVVASDLVSERVHFSDAADLGRYYRVEDQLPSELRLVGGVGAGDLLPRSAVGSAATEAKSAEISIEVDPGLLPTTVARGTHVDVYLTGDQTGSTGGTSGGPRRGGTSQAGTTPALSDVSVVDAPAGQQSFGQSGSRQLVLSVPAGDVAGYYQRVGAVANPVVSVVALSR